LADVNVTISSMPTRHNTTCYQDDQLGVGVQQQLPASTDQVLYSARKHLSTHISFFTTSHSHPYRTRPSSNDSYPRSLLSSPRVHPPPATFCPFHHSSLLLAALQHPRLSRTTHPRWLHTGNSLPSTSSSSRHPPSHRWHCLTSYMSTLSHSISSSRMSASWISSSTSKHYMPSWLR
jgi:hypothetical protein